CRRRPFCRGRQRNTARARQRVEVEEERAVRRDDHQLDVATERLDVAPLKQQRVLRKLLVDELHRGGLTLGADAGSVRRTTRQGAFLLGFLVALLDTELRFLRLLLRNLLLLDRRDVFCGECDVTNQYVRDFKTLWREQIAYAFFACQFQRAILGAIDLLDPELCQRATHLVAQGRADQHVDIAVLPVAVDDGGVGRADAEDHRDIYLDAL